jgi:hypothetical protein
MTIKADWVKILKTNVPQAFTATPATFPDVVFVDGQIKLMKGEHVTTWEGFLRQQFVNTIEQAFALGAPVVVMGFDDYTHVPRSKNMTQAKRNRSVPTVFSEDQPGDLQPGGLEQRAGLPPRPPQDWCAAMRNRTFKVKVVQFVVNSLKQHYKLEQRRSVVLDFQGVPEVVCGSYQLPALFARHSAATPLRRGECDIKGPDYLPHKGTLLLISTDGDFIPIALLQLERHLRESGQQANIIVNRMKVKTTAGAKRDAAGSSKRREYEYVDIRLLLDFLTKEFARSASPAAHFASLVALTGCDFSMNLPALSPSKIWAFRSKLRENPLRECVDIVTALVVMYQQLLQNKCRGVGPETIRSITDTRGATQVYALLHASALKSLALGERTKKSLWKADRVCAHACNVIWTLLYWTELHAAPEPLSGNFGYVAVKNHVRYEAECTGV